MVLVFDNTITNSGAPIADDDSDRIKKLPMTLSEQDSFSLREYLQEIDVINRIHLINDRYTNKN